MPDKRRGFKHFFCQHPIVGVNWRTTWLVEEPADSTVCSVCGMIPRKTVRLPCGHFLCRPCRDSCSQAGGGSCPVDKIPFKEERCNNFSLSSTKVKHLNVYCWNEANGCNFIGTPGQSLLHFENECGFHARVCPLCQKEVLHKDLVAHRRDECSSNASPSCTRRSDSHSNDVPSEGFDLTQKGADMVAGDTSEDTALPMPATSATGDTDANESSEKAVDGYSSNDIALPARLTLTSKGLNVTEENENNFTLNTFRDSALPTDQIEMNEQRTHLSSEEATLDNVTPGVRSSEQTLREEITEIIREAISSCLPQQLSSRELVGQHATPPPPSTLSPEETLILRKLEHFANTTLSTLEDLRQIMTEQVRRQVTARCESALSSHDRLRRLTVVERVPLRTDDRVPSISYLLTIENAAHIFSNEDDYRLFAEITDWHMRDTYFILSVRKNVVKEVRALVIEIELNALVDSLPYLPTILGVKALDIREHRIDLQESQREHCTCVRGSDTLPHFHQVFFIQLSSLRNCVSRNGRMRFQIDVASKVIEFV